MNYKAKNIDVDKMLKALHEQRKEALIRHSHNIEIENARYKQELADIEEFEAMFRCSNYEKTEKGGVDNV